MHIISVNAINENTEIHNHRSTTYAWVSLHSISPELSKLLFHSLAYFAYWQHPLYTVPIKYKLQQHRDHYHLCIYTSLVPRIMLGTCVLIRYLLNAKMYLPGEEKMQMQLGNFHRVRSLNWLLNNEYSIYWIEKND